MSDRPAPGRNRALSYDEALARRVLGAIAQGAMLRDLWRDETMPTRGDLRRWRQADPDFNARLCAAVNAARSRRMSTYSQASAGTILYRIGQGESLRTICGDPAMPSLATVMLWLKERRDFADAMAIAREIQAEILLDLGSEIMGSITPENASAGPVKSVARPRIGRRHCAARLSQSNHRSDRRSTPRCRLWAPSLLAKSFAQLPRSARTFALKPSLMRCCPFMGELPSVQTLCCV